MIYFCINNAHGPTRPWPDQSYIACYGPEIGLQLASCVTVYIFITQVYIHYVHILCDNISKLYLLYKYSSVQVVIIN